MSVSSSSWFSGSASASPSAAPSSGGFSAAAYAASFAASAASNLAWAISSISSFENASPLIVTKFGKSSKKLVKISFLISYPPTSTSCMLKCLRDLIFLSKFNSLGLVIGHLSKISVSRPGNSGMEWSLAS